MLLSNPAIAVVLLFAAPIEAERTADDAASHADGVEALLDRYVEVSEDAGAPVYFQLRIEQRIILRVPRQTSTGRRSLGDVRSIPPTARRYTSRKIGKCIPMNSVAGVQITSQDQLLLYLRDRRLVRAELENRCRARDFYSGFYLEMSEDGRLCTGRDVLHSRSGAKCEIERIRQLVPEEG